MTPFEKRCELLNYMFITTYGLEEYEDFRYEEDLFLYSATAIFLGMVTPGELMISHINRVFEDWLSMSGKDEDTGFNTIYEIDPGLAVIDFEYMEEDLKDSLAQRKN
jgi:hypothetical protein